MHCIRSSSCSKRYSGSSCLFRRLGLQHELVLLKSSLASAVFEYFVSTKVADSQLLSLQQTHRGAAIRELVFSVKIAFSTVTACATIASQHVKLPQLPAPTTAHSSTADHRFM